MFKWLNKFFKKNQKVNLQNLEYLIFGRFTDNDYDSYKIYKLTHTELFVDSREIWHSKRQTKEGYTFEGELMLERKFKIAKNLINQVPDDILDKNLNGFYTTGNKNEDQLVVALFDGNFKKEITINDYVVKTENLPNGLKNFRLLIEHKLKELN